uniref:Astacin domain-containing protein n=1 Tax=Strongyloides papillosus TaxID=174720 RepID=A0A0N5BQ12_STREA
MKNNMIIFSSIILFLYFDLTFEWVKFDYKTRNRVYRWGKNSTIELCQNITAQIIFGFRNQTYTVTMEDKEILKAFKGIGLYTPVNRFYYRETYSRVTFKRVHDSIFYPEISKFSYVGDCACGDSLCTYFQAICIYTYWFGRLIYGNHSMCTINPVIAWKSMNLNNG